MRVRAAFIAVLTALAVGDTAHAATWNVVGTGDGGTCDEKTQVCQSLRAAIAASEATKEEPDTINVPPGVININNDLVIQSDITVNGSSARTTIIDGGFKYRGFRVTSSGNAKINHLTVRNGAANQGNSTDGGGILNAGGAVQLNTVRVTGSQAEGRGGGIANHQGTLTLVNGLVDNNTAGDGGGISNFGGAESPDRGLLGVATTTIFKNMAGTGGAGGISSRGGQLNIVLLNLSTVADNAGGARGVGGLLIQSGAAQIVGDLFARNTVAGEGVVNCAPRPVDGGGNLEDETDCIDAGGNANPDLATALRSEGGELDVLPLGEKSQAIDRNSVLCSAPDARGLGRPQGPACDSGAYEVDQAPRVTITAGPSGTVATPDVQFEFESTEPGVTYQCQLTGPGQTPGFTGCKSPQSHTGLANGAYTFSVRAMDGQFADPPVESRSFTVAALDTTITGGPPNPTNDTTPTFAFIGVNGAIGFQCRVDGEVFTTCTSPHTTAPLNPGTHTFEVRALSVSGAPDPTPASQTFVIDTTAPDTTITSGPSGTVASTTAAFTFSSTEAGSTFQCSLDGGAFGACPLNYTGLSQGQHTFAVHATDPAGNTDGSPATRTWTIDTIAPNPPVITTPVDDALLISGTIAFQGTAEPGVTVQLREGTTLVGSAIASGTGSWTIVLGAVPDGIHTYAARAIDAANNTSEPTTRTVTVDSTMPETTITGGPDGLTNDDTPTFTFSSEANATFECSLDGAAHTACSNPFTTPPLSQGAHTLSVRAVDLAGNRDNTPATRNFTVDSIAPDTTITSGPIGAVSSTTATFTFTSTEAGSTFQCSLDGAAFGTCPTSYTGLSQGPHTFAVRATDAAGNTDPSPASQNWTVDTQAPPAPVITAPPNASHQNTQTVTLSGTAEVGSTVEVREGATLRGSATATGGNWTVQITNVAEGTHTYTATARDAAGN
ncbi:MAG TPA: Ig-like domain-containing protein, partial [Solirubrobacter sp.]|nr:Ig-like domain-containing protein [Solirubrobacter sp.]